MAAPDAEALPPVSDEGVDLRVVRWLLDQTPEDRLRRLEEAVRSLSRLAIDRAL